MKATSHTPCQIALLVSCLLQLGALPAPAAAFTVNPAADAFVTPGATGGLRNFNFGRAGALSIAAPGLASGEFQSVLRFDLSGARSSFDAQFGAGQWSIQSMTLSLTAASPLNSIFNASAAGQFNISWMQNDSWVEGTGKPSAPSTTGVTFANIFSFTSPADEDLGTFAFAGGTNGSATYALRLAPDLAADAAAGNLISLRLFAAGTGISYLFNSRNFGIPSDRPLLSIIAVPEPSTLSLAAAALALLPVARSLARRRGQPKRGSSSSYSEHAAQ